MSVPLDTIRIRLCQPTSGQHLIKWCGSGTRISKAQRDFHILFVTGDIFNPKVLRFMDQTQSPYLVKPFETGELRQAVRRLLAARTPAAS